ncbi:MAG: phytanoyl-CoA dioxygenase family protein [Alphaproteobacteria bacterium]
MTLLKSVLLSPLHVASLATSAKSFRKNPVLGNPTLNRWGLHVARARLAERMADARRRRLTHLLSKEHREAFAEQGYVLVENVLTDEAFRTLSEEVEGTRFPTTERRLGEAVTRYVTLSPRILKQTPALDQFVNGGLFQGLMRYVASGNVDPVLRLQTIITDPGSGPRDNVTALHSYTFHSTSKGWMYLRDVTTEDGPFCFVPGSHRMTPARLAWEFEQSLSAAKAENGIHANGSFRVPEDAIASMGYPASVEFAVKANSMVIADTHGFHARRPSLRRSVRLAIYSDIRVSPFKPYAGPDIFDIPGLRNRKAELVDFSRSINAKITGRPQNHPYVGDLLPGDDPVV